MMMRVILLDMLNMRQRKTRPYTMMMPVIMQDMLNMRERESERERDNTILSDDACHLAINAKHEREGETTT